MSKRKSIGPKLRFEVFRRDGFTCAYCGETPPAAVLQVDHFKPVAEGGTDDLENLVTACFECNSGKSSTVVEGVSPARKRAPSKAEMEEALEQMRAYADFQREKVEIEDQLLSDFSEAWCKAFDGCVKDGYFTCDTYFPYQSMVKKYLRSMGLPKLVDALDITRSRMGVSKGPGCARYFSGILRRWEEEGGAK